MTNHYHFRMTKKLFTLILLVSTLAQIIANIYLPSLPFIALEWNISYDQAQLTLGVYLLGFGISHLIYGPLSDSIGRRKPLLFGIGLSSLGSLICALSPQLSVFITGRLIQGMGVGVCGSVGRTLARDLLTGRELSRLGSHLGMASTLMLAAAPVLGGYFQEYYGWRVDFYFLLIYTLLIWIILFFKLPETRKGLPAKSNLPTVFRNYMLLTTSKEFITYTLCTCFAYAGFTAYITVSPFIFQDQMGVSPVEYGWLAYVIAITLLISSFLNSKLVMITSIKTMMWYGIIFMFIGSILLFILATSISMHIITLLSCFIFFTAGAGLVFSNAYVGAFHFFSEISGTASALYGTAQILSGALASWIIVLFNFSGLTSLSIFLLLLTALTAVSLWLSSIRLTSIQK